MKILVDMNLAPRWATDFVSRGFEATHWSAIGAATAPDDEVLGWCAANGHVLFTHDLDFGAILAASGARAPSVVQLRTENAVPEAMLDRMVAALNQLRDELASGSIVSIEPHRHRIRLLPLSRA